MVHTHARLQHEVTQVRWCSVWCKWVKYPEGVETHTSMGKPGEAESPTGTLVTRHLNRPLLGGGEGSISGEARYHFQEWLPGLKRLAFLGGPRLDGRPTRVSQWDPGTFACGLG